MCAPRQARCHGDEAATAAQARAEAVPETGLIFTRPFQPATEKIQLLPRRFRGLYWKSNEIVVRTTDGSGIRVMDLRGRVVYEGAPTSLKLPTGHYFVECDGDRAQFAVLPDDWPKLERIGWSGAHDPIPHVLEKADRLRLGWVRGHFDWNRIQPDGPQSWDWSAMDQMMAAHYGKRKLEMLLNGIPGWARDPVTKEWKISGDAWLVLYERLAHAVAKRYGTKVDMLEIWNEPWHDNLPLEGRRDLSKFYVEMLKIGRRAFPRTKLSGPAFNSPPMWREATAVANAGGRELLDYCVFHDYQMCVEPPDAGFTIEERVQRHRDAFGKPLVVDELGLYGASALGLARDTSERLSGLSWQRGMCRSIKYAVMYLAHDVILMPHILLGAGPMEFDGWEAGHRGPHPKTTAFLMACYWIHRGKFQGSRVLNRKVFLYEWRQPQGGSVVFAWCTEGNSVRLNPALKFEVTDVFGQRIKPDSLQEEPILFHVRTQPAGRAALDAVADAIGGG